MGLNTATELAVDGVMIPLQAQHGDECLLGVDNPVLGNASPSVFESLQLQITAAVLVLSNGTVEGLSDGRNVPAGVVTIAKVLDGTAHTMMVGEQSDFCRGNPPAGPVWNPDERRDIRSSDSRGAFMGTSYVTKAEGPNSMLNCMGAGNNNCQRCYNTTSIFWPINRKTYDSNTMDFQRCGTPIQSVHPAGAHLLMADGHVIFAREAMPLNILKNLADRDDGTAVSL